MAIRSTNANRRGGTADDLARDMKASKGRGSSGGGQPGNRGEGDPVNGYPFGSTTPGYIDYRDIEANGPFYPGTTRQRYQDDPNARKLHTPGSDRQSQVDKYFGREDRYGKKRPEEPWSWTAEDEANDQAEQAQRRADEDAGWKKRGYAGSDWWKSDPEYQQLLASGNEKGAYRRKGALLSKAKDDIALKAFIAQGGTEETYRNRFNRDWPKPRSPLGAYSHGPGSADWDTRFTNPVPPNTAGGGRSGGGGNDAANRPSSGRELNEWLRDHPNMDSLPGWAVDPGFSKSPRMGGGRGGMIEGYLGSGGATEDLPPGASFDMPSSNILSALKPLSDNLWNGNKPTGSGTASPAKKPTVVRRGGGRTDAR